MGWFVSHKIIGNITTWQSSYNFPFNFNRKYASISYSFRVIASYLSKVTNFNLTYLHLACLSWWTPFEFTKIFGIRKLKWHCLCDPMFSHFGVILACDKHKHDDSIYCTNMASSGKKQMKNFWFSIHMRHYWQWLGLEVYRVWSVESHSRGLGHVVQKDWQAHKLNR